MASKKKKEIVIKVKNSHKIKWEFFYMKNELKVIFVIIGTLVGAGVISGQEMYTFFYVCGAKGLLGLVLCSCLVSLIVYKTFKIILKRDVTEYREFLNVLSNKRKGKYFNLPYITNIVINIFIFVTFCIMISGFGAYFSQEIQMDSVIGSLILAVICFVVLMGNMQGIVKTNELLVPIIIIFILVVGFYNLRMIDISNLENILIEMDKENWIINSVLYSSYNIILLVPILVNLKKYISNEKEIKNISIVTGIIIFILSSILFLLLTRIDCNIENVEMPIAYVISNTLPQFKKVYGIIILISIFTTALSLGLSFLENVTSNKKSYTQIAVIMCITSVLLSKFGFSNLINLLYPIFGVLGIVQILNILRVKNKI